MPIMISMRKELDIHRSTCDLIREYGEDAPIFAAMEADVMLDAGDLDSYGTWRRILATVKELCRTSPSDGESTH